VLERIYGWGEGEEEVRRTYVVVSEINLLNHLDCDALRDFSLAM